VAEILERNGVKNEEFTEKFRGNFCNYDRTSVDYPIASIFVGCNDYHKYFSFHDNLIDNHEHKRAIGIFHLSGSAPGYYPAAFGVKCIYHT